MTPATTPALTLNNDVTMPALGLGVFQSPPEETTAAVETALRDGYRLIDTAAAYDNEREVGEGIRRSGVDRDEIFVDHQAVDQRLRLRRRRCVGFERACAGSASTTSTCYLLHQPVPTALRGHDRRLQGRRDVARRRPGARDRRLELQRRAPAPAARPHRRRAGGQPGRAAPVLHAARAARGSTPSTASSRRRGRRSAACSSTCHGADESRGPLTDPVITDLAAKYGKTPAQVVLRWHIEHGFGAIPKSVKPHRIAENFDVFDFALTAEEVAAIDALDTGVRGGPDPETLSPETYPKVVDNS